VELYLHSHNTPSWRAQLKKHRDNFTFTFLPLPIIIIIIIVVVVVVAVKGKVRVLNCAPRHEDVLRGAGIAARILDVGTRVR
jgi:hypothetical protein